MTITVRWTMARSMASCTRCSDSASSALVACAAADGQPDAGARRPRQAARTPCLVEQEDLRVHQERARDGDPLLLPAAQLHAPLADECVEPLEAGAAGRIEAGDSRQMLPVRPPPARRASLKES